jgi:hypothetical protein
MVIGNLFEDLTRSEKVDMSAVGRVFFFLIQHGYTELEWLMPLLHSYKSRNVTVVVLLPGRPANSRQKIMLEWLNRYADNVLYGSDLLKSSWLLRLKQLTRFEGQGLVMKKLRQLMKSIESKEIGRKLLFYFEYLSTIHVRKILKDSDLVYCPEGAFPEVVPEGFAKLIRFSARSLKKPLVGYLKSMYSDIRGLTTRNNGLDLLLVLSEHDQEICEIAGLPAIVIGAQRFKESWIKETFDYFSGKQECQELRNLSAIKSLVLILLKNRTGLVQNAISEQTHLGYRKKMFQALIARGFHLLIKPHPTEDSSLLEEVLEDIDSNCYTISEIPAQYLAGISMCTVCEMPSNSLMDSIAIGKKSYWPYHLIFDDWATLSEQEIVDRYLSGGFPKNFIKFVELKLPEQKKSFPISDDLKKQFRSLAYTQVDIEHAIAVCESAVLRQA